MSRLHYRLSSTLQLINDWDLDLCQACKDLSRKPPVLTTYKPKKRSCLYTNRLQMRQAMALATFRGVTQWVNRN